MSLSPDMFELLVNIYHRLEEGWTIELHPPVEESTPIFDALTEKYNYESFVTTWEDWIEERAGRDDLEDSEYIDVPEEEINKMLRAVAVSLYAELWNGLPNTLKAIPDRLDRQAWMEGAISVIEHILKLKPRNRYA